MTYRHGFRVGEVIDLKWDQIDLDHAKLHVNRMKNGESSVHFLEGDEIRALRKLKRVEPESAFVFYSERQGPLSSNAVYKIVSRAGSEAGLDLSVRDTERATSWPLQELTLEQSKHTLGTKTFNTPFCTRSWIPVASRDLAKMQNSN